MNTPEGRGLDTGEDQRTLTKAGTTRTTDTDHRHNAAIRAFAKSVIPQSASAMLLSIGQIAGRPAVVGHRSRG
jgi:hypothetical protein